VQLKMLDGGLEPPSYAHPGDAGADLRAREDVLLEPGQRRLVPTGVSIALFPQPCRRHRRRGSDVTQCHRQNPLCS
jgi:dUTPase